MIKTKTNFIFNRKILKLAVLLVCCSCLPGYLFSRDHWNRSYNTMYYNPVSKGIVINFICFDYSYGPANENGYLKWCDIEFSEDGQHYERLMRVETHDQKFTPETWVITSNKLSGSEIKFLTTIYPSAGSIWPDGTDQKPVVSSRPSHTYEYGLYFPHAKDKVTIAFLWLVDTPGRNFDKVKYMRINGFWKVNGVYDGDKINYETWDVLINGESKSTNKNNSLSTFKKEVNVAEPKVDNNVKIYAVSDEIVIEGVDKSENISVYNAAGEEVKSRISNDDVIKIKLPKNNIYIVTIGKSRYKIAL